MNNKECKKETVDLIDTMIEHADKGPSGFWTDDYEGCGNPAIFPEFEEGLKHGKFIQKRHKLCPWNTAVLYGEGHGNILTGCYHSCSINDAKYLTADMLKAILSRFKKNLLSGQYDNTDHIVALLTTEECDFINRQKDLKTKERMQKSEKDRAEKSQKAATLLKKYQSDERLQAVIIAHYGENTVLSDYGGLDFSPKAMNDIVGGEKLSYNDYLDIQIQSNGKQRTSFKNCYYNYPCEFKGQIEKITKDTICFNRIYILGMYLDGDMFEGKEDHVWMDKKGFESFKVGDCVKFFAEVYRYLKTSNGKLIDYSLRNPEGIKKIGSYELPSDEELIMQEIDYIICETCYLGEQCNRMCCMRPQKEIRQLKKQMMQTIQGNNSKKQ